ncbi:MAG: M28 family peptidase [Acidobacteriaceae bacterium]
MRSSFLVWTTAIAALCSLPAQAQRFSGEQAFKYTRQFVAIGPRYINSEGHLKAEAYIKSHFAPEAAQKRLEVDGFVANTPIGPVAMRNYIVKYPGKKAGIIVLGTHYETNYPLRNIGFVGANDGGSTTGLLMEIGDLLRAQTTGNKRLDGYSVWLVFFDGEEAIQQWSDSDKLYGSRHLAAKWSNDGTIHHIKAFLLADMLGDKSLDIDRDLNSTQWLLDLVYDAAKDEGVQSHFFARENQVDDDHIPFVERGVPSADIIDFDYGPHSFLHPDGYHHTAEDTMDKLSPNSLQIAGDVFMKSIQLIDQR